MRPAYSPRISKTRFLAGRQCHRLLWWTVHDAEELEVDAGVSATLAQGLLVGEEARRQFHHGALVDVPHNDIDERIKRTRSLLRAGAKVIFEAAFRHAGVFVAVDVLRRHGSGWDVIEVKSSTKLKKEHVVDVAVQRWVIERCGLRVKRAFVMHLSRDSRAPEMSNLFALKSVTAASKALARDVAKEARAQLRMLRGPLPEVDVGAHCTDPRPCPFLDRCHDDVEEHHVSTLHGIGSRALGLVARGITNVADLDEGAVRSVAAQRQIRAVKTRKIVVEPGLRRVVKRLRKKRIALFDLETVAFAVPRFSGCRPWDQVPAQASIDVEARDGTLKHHEFLATCDEDPRPELARFVIERLRGADTILCWNAGFERRCLQEIGNAFPELRRPLRGLSRRIVDLLSIVREHVYHPKFYGSFSLKSVAPALVPRLSYDELAVGGGQAASAMLFRLFNDVTLTKRQRRRIRDDLLAYCALDTRAMAGVLRALRRLAR
ncbi:MAG: DUF2779 domain-containing protein [Deltaproteobacteria bacterium]|nr:DUF2779 domain-containing protein [Deltaproteobacteria bacterium]